MNRHEPFAYLPTDTNNLVKIIKHGTIRILLLTIIGINLLAVKGLL